MQYIKKLPVLIRWLVTVFLSFLLPMTIFRFIFFFRYNPSGKAFSGSSFLMGLRFDAKFVSMLIVLILLLCAFKKLNPFKNPGASKFWNIFLPFIFLIVMFFYVADYYHYDYLHQRLNATILSFAGDAGISSKMMMQSYPVFSIIFLLIVLTVAVWFIFKKILSSFVKEGFIKQKGRVWMNVAFFILLGLTVFGKTGQFPLRWSDAFTLSDDFKSNLALNPFQSFFSTLRFTDSKPDMKMVKKYYALMAAHLGVKNPDSVLLNYERNYSFGDTTNASPNVVVVICESFSMYKSSMSGNPLNTTPYFNNLCSQGRFFDRCFTPAYGTARGVWATVTGIPDVLGASKETASRNPGAVDQHVIINDFKGYDRFYFLGGDPTWANIQGFLKNNIEGLQLYSQESFKAAKVDVWGISDKHLFLEANQILANQQKPFFAIIQTADNHRPYTIPAEDLNRFTKVSYPKDTLMKYGFESNDELNAFRYTDFCYQEFIESAKKEKYFDNTIFVFVGDHGIGGPVGNLYPKSWIEQHLDDEHVPLLFYSPKYIQPKKIDDVCSQIDILPSVASIAKMSYSTRTLGRNLFDTTIHSDSYAFIMEHNENTIGVVNNKYYFVKNIVSGKEDFVSITDNEKIFSNPYTDSVRASLKNFTNAYYNTSKYLIVNNKKK